MEMTRNGIEEMEVQLMYNQVQLSKGLKDEIIDEKSLRPRKWGFVYSIVKEALGEVKGTWKNEHAIFATALKCLKDMMFFVAYLKHMRLDPEKWLLDTPFAQDGTRWRYLLVNMAGALGGALQW
jgi:hypothetical protein